MAYILPSFNLVANVHTYAFGAVGVLRIANQPCQLRAPSPNYSGILQPSASQYTAMCAMWPALTDIRDVYTGTFNQPDVVEIPAGSGRYYQVQMVDDIGKGFANEHRFCTLLKATYALWPIPIP